MSFQNTTENFLEAKFYETFQNSFCIPAEVLLKVLDVHQIDFFSLDVEGAEMDILRTFPFHKITVDVWAIERLKPNNQSSPDNYKRPTVNYNTTANHKNATNNHNPSYYTSNNNNVDQNYEIEDVDFIQFMEYQGYYLFDMFCSPISDYIFIRRGSAIFEGLHVPKKFWKRRKLCLEKGNFNPNLPLDSKYLRDKHHWPNLTFKA